MRKSSIPCKPIKGYGNLKKRKEKGIMTTIRVFGTLAYAKFLVSRGVEAKTAEALAEANQEFLINDLATKEFVRTEIITLENRLNKANAKMLAFAVGVILAGIPIVLALVQKLS